MILVAFLLGLALSLVGIVFVSVRGVSLWRQGKRTGRAITSELSLFEERSARTEQLLGDADRVEPGTPGRARASPPLPRAAAGAAWLARGRTAPDSLAARVPADPMTRVAAVDLGTNSTRLLVADVDGGSVEEVVRRARDHAARRGRRPRRRLLPVPDRPRPQRARRLPARARGARRRADARVATSAVRDAENGEAFLGEIEWSYGFTTRLLSGDEEAAMTIRGVSAGARLDRTRSSSTSAAARPSSCSRPTRSSPRRASTSAASG